MHICDLKGLNASDGKGEGRERAFYLVPAPEVRHGPVDCGARY